jgi:predicted DNA-binding transcriptional regulator YafY
VTEKVLEQYKNTPYAKYFKNFYEKISNLFDRKITVDVKDIDRILSFHVGPARKVDEKIMQTVERALRECIRANMIYLTGYTGAVSERKIDIYHLKNHLGDWYVIGHDYKRNKIKIFAVSRIKEISLTNQRFEVPESFDINKYFEDSFGIFESNKIYNVKLKIMNESARYISEKQWHKSQKITNQKDGSILVEYKINNLTDMFFWVLSLGRDCEVLQPKEFREEVKRELKEAGKNYK